MSSQTSNDPIPSNIWAQLVQDPSTGVSIVSRDGKILYVNPQSAEMYVGPDTEPDSLIGDTLAERFPEQWVDERVELIHKILDDGEPRLLRTIWRGVQLHAWISPINVDQASDDEDHGGPRVLVLTHRVTGNELPEGMSHEIVDSAVMGLGELDRLSPRELEVLALLGRGLSLKRIAELLHRSHKTIENHRNSIGQKLQINDRVRLAELALIAGLRQDDVNRTRVESTSERR